MLSYFLVKGVMKISLLEPHGYCSGVSRAITMSLEIKNKHPKQDVYVLGMLVHNEDVVQFLKEKNIISLYEKGKSLEELLLLVPENQVVIFTAHGHPVNLDEIAKKRNLIIYDAICPKVQFSQNIIKQEIANHHQVIFIGYKNHPETEGCLSLDKDVILYDLGHEFHFDKITDESPLVINQTTLNFLELKEVHDLILSYFPKARIANEMCPTTRRRQEALSTINDEEAIIVIGDPKSSNTSRLYELAKTLHPDLDVIKVANKDELPLDLLRNKKSVAISTGASTPDFITNTIIDILKDLN